jgi:hypothetical protein
MEVLCCVFSGVSMWNNLMAIQVETCYSIATTKELKEDLQQEVT